MQDVNVFISHRHSDKGIADVINVHLQEWGVPEEAIFQSSRPRQGPMIGAPLDVALRKKLTKVNLLILVYTFDDEDWSYCMWECGVATGKSTVETRIVVFQCTQDVPKIFQNQTRVMITEGEIKGFVDNFHRKKDFIPGLVENGEKPKALAPKIGAQVLKSRKERFYNDLKNEVPAGSMTSVHLWDFLRLKLEHKHLQEIQKKGGDEAISIIYNHTEILEPQYVGVDTTVGTALRQFGYQAFQSGLKLTDLIERWQSEDKTKSDAWINDLLIALYRAISNRPSAAVSNYFKSVRVGTTWKFLPVVTRVRGFPDNRNEFDVYLIRVGLDGMINSKDTEKSSSS